MIFRKFFNIIYESIEDINKFKAETRINFENFRTF